MLGPSRCAKPCIAGLVVSCRIQREEGKILMLARVWLVSVCAVSQPGRRQNQCVLTVQGCQWTPALRFPVSETPLCLSRGSMLRTVWHAAADPQQVQRPVVPWPLHPPHPVQSPAKSCIAQNATRCTASLAPSCLEEVSAALPKSCPVFHEPALLHQATDMHTDDASLYAVIAVCVLNHSPIPPA